MISMSHRQRVQTALEHREPDFVPLDFGTGGNTSPVPEVYAKLAAIYHIPCNLKLVPHIMRLAVVDERILQDLDIDTRPIYMHPVPHRHRPCDEPSHYYDEWGVKWREYDLGGVIYREIAESPLQNASLDDLESYPWWPDPLDPQRYAGLEGEAARLFHETDYALVGCPAFNSLWERAYFLCGFARMLEGLLSEPEFVHAVFRKITDIVKASLARYLTLVGPYLQVVKMGDDLGAQDNALMSPNTYRKTIKPYHQELFQFIRQNSPARVFLHTCGSVYKLLPDLIDAGVEILNPVQVSARDMDTQRLKREYGDRLSFWGAIDTQQVLPKGSMDEVRDEVSRRIADLAPGGGYVVAPVHNVQADVPAENVLTLYRTARQVGRYPLSFPPESSSL
jgi:uroporphyrinogen decarboxylase